MERFEFAFLSLTKRLSESYQVYVTSILIKTTQQKREEEDRDRGRESESERERENKER